MDVLAADSPVSAEDFTAMLGEVTGVQLCPIRDFTEVLNLLIRRKEGTLSQKFGLVMSPVDEFHCWLLKAGSGAGVYFYLRNKPDGIRIAGVRDLGGSRRCGMRLAL